MDYHGAFALLLLLVSFSWCLTLPVADVEKYVDKRTLDDTFALNPMLTPYGIYPGIKPLKPFLPPDFFLNRFATPTPADLTPMGIFFKAKKDEFLSNLFDQLSVPLDAPEKSVRAVTEAADYDDSVVDTTATTPKPKIDPSAFMAKKFDFLSKLFVAINTTVAPTAAGATTDPTATTIKPTIVPPGFWIPATISPKPPKAPKATKAPKPAKTEPLSLSAADGVLLKAFLSSLTPADSLVTSDKSAREVSFLDAFLHRVTTPQPESATEETIDSNNLEGRSMIFPPGYWIPPYIYAAKMGIYLDKLFDTINIAAEAEETSDDIAKRSVEAVPSTTPGAPALILAELTSLKNSLVAAYAESLTASKATPSTTSGKSTPKPFKGAFWALKTTPAPDPAQSKIDMLSEVFDKLVEVQQALLTGQGITVAPPTLTDSAVTTESPTIVPPSYWAPDPSALDMGTYYKTKTQGFLSQLFAATTVDPTDG